ncbi:MAG: hypothetical protein ACJ74D_10195 [Gaiellaceae bacterium]
MFRYFYAWTPLVFVATLVLLALPWLGLIALMIVALVALPALAFALVLAPYLLFHAISRRLQARHSASRPAVVLAATAHRATLRKGYVS